MACAVGVGLANGGGIIEFISCDTNGYCGVLGTLGTTGGETGGFCRGIDFGLDCGRVLLCGMPGICGGGGTECTFCRGMLVHCAGAT